LALPLGNIKSREEHVLQMPVYLGQRQSLALQGKGQRAGEL